MVSTSRTLTQTPALFRFLVTTSIIFLCGFLLFLVRIRPNFEGELRLKDDDDVNATSVDGQLELRMAQASCDGDVEVGHTTTTTGGSYRGMHDVCKCPRANGSLYVTVHGSEHPPMSSCSDHATARGPNQKIIVYAFYGTIDSKYFNGTAVNVDAVKQMYPGWVIRVYHNLSLDNEVEATALCDLWCDHDYLDFCDVRHLPPDLCDRHTVFGMLWRFFPLGDPLVERFSVRDIDSVILQREVDSVNEWIRENKTWHVMRDNVQHTTHILGGMWGGMNRDLNQNLQLRNRFLAKGGTWQKGYDQHLLTDILWPVAQKDMTSHDSYLCRQYPGSEPWPTRRVDGEFVGDAFPWENEPRKPKVCPAACRPKEHQDWTTC